MCAAQSGGRAARGKLGRHSWRLVVQWKLPTRQLLPDFQAPNPNQLTARPCTVVEAVWWGARGGSRGGQVSHDRGKGGIAE